MYNTPKTPKMTPKESGTLGGRILTEQREERLKAAALLSQTTPPAEICRVLDIDTQTLKRYSRDPLWKQHGGAELPRYFTKNGRPPDDPEAEKQLLTEAYALRKNGMKWYEVASELQVMPRRLVHLRSKYPEISEADARETQETETLQKAICLRKDGMKLKDIPDALGITPNRLLHLRRKYAETLTID